MVNRALASHWRIALEEPGKTAITLGAAYLINILPKRLYARLAGIALPSQVPPQSVTKAKNPPPLAKSNL